MRRKSKHFNVNKHWRIYACAFLSLLGPIIYTLRQFSVKFAIPSLSNPLSSLGTGFAINEIQVADPVAGLRGDEKHEIYVATFGSHLFYDLFLQSRAGEHGPLGPLPDPLLSTIKKTPITMSQVFWSEII